MPLHQRAVSCQLTAAFRHHRQTTHAQHVQGKIRGIFTPTERNKALRMLALIVPMAMTETASALSIMLFLSVPRRPAILGEPPMDDLALAKARADFEESDLPFRGYLTLWKNLPENLQQYTAQSGQML